MQYRYADGHGLSMLALVAVVLLSLGGQRGDASSVFPLTVATTEQPVTEIASLTTAAQLPPVSPMPAESQLPPASPFPDFSQMQTTAEPGGPPLSEFEEARTGLLALRATLSSRGERTSTPLAPTSSLASPAASVPTSTPTRVPVKPIGAVDIPILMYHHIDIAGPTADAIRRDLSVPPASFAAQMSYLARNGYHAISVLDLVEYLATGKPLPPSPVVLTFDDGYLDNYTNAFPVLKGLGFTGTFFIITDFVGQGEYMSWEHAARMATLGMDLESHTLDHPDLTTLSADRLSRQMSESRAVLESRLGKPVRYLSYPAGRYDGAVMRAAEKAGYLGSVTTVYGESHAWVGRYELTRIRVRGTDSLDVFAQKVHGPNPKPAPSASTATVPSVASGAPSTEVE